MTSIPSPRPTLLEAQLANMINHPVVIFIRVRIIWRKYRIPWFVFPGDFLLLLWRLIPVRVCRQNNVQQCRHGGVGSSFANTGTAGRTGEFRGVGRSSSPGSLDEEPFFQT